MIESRRFLIKELCRLFQVPLPAGNAAAGGG
jgi:hypothetical protein